MTSKLIFSAVAVVGIAAASGAAYWYQNKPTGPTEMTGNASSAAPGASAPRSGAPSGGGGGVGPGGPAGVEVAKVELTRLQDDAQSVGSMRSRQNAMLRPEVAGRIVAMGFADGGRVRRGDMIVQLDDVLQRAEVRQADAQVSIARANFKRNQELVAQNFVAQRVLDEAAANVQVVEAQLALACARWDRMRISAPFDGTVGIRNINIGDYVKDGADLVNIEDLSSMYVDFKLPERFQGKLRSGQQVELQLDAMPGRAFKAKIEAIDPQIDANARSISVRAVLPNTAGEPLRAQGPALGASAAVSSAPAASGARSAASAAKTAIAPARAKAVTRPLAAASAASAGPSARAVADAVVASCAPFGVRSASASPARAGGGNVSNGGNAGNQAGAGKSGSPVAKSAMAGPAQGAGGGPLRPGMFARVNTVFSIKDNSLTVPEEAIVPQGGRQFVIKVVQQTQEQANALAEAAKQAAAAAAATAASAAAAAGSAGGAAVPAMAAASAPAAPSGFVDGKRLVSQRVEVKIGIRRPGRVEITEGVAEGETIVVAGQQRLQRDNMPVRIVELGRPGGGGAGSLGGAGGSGGAASAGGSGTGLAAQANAPAASATQPPAAAASR